MVPGVTDEMTTREHRSFEVCGESAASGDMTMRSWYMPKASADRLAALVDDVHFSTRLPKHLIMDALVNVADRYRAEVEAEAQATGGGQWSTHRPDPAGIAEPARRLRQVRQSAAPSPPPALPGLRPPTLSPDAPAAEGQAATTIRLRPETAAARVAMTWLYRAACESAKLSYPEFAGEIVAGTCRLEHPARQLCPLRTHWRRRTELREPGAR